MVKVVVIGVGSCGARIVERIPKMKNLKRIAILKTPKDLGYTPKVDKVISLTRMYRYKDHIVVYYGGVIEIYKIRKPTFTLTVDYQRYHVRRLKKLRDKALIEIVKEMIKNGEWLSTPFIDVDPFSVRKIRYFEPI